MLKKIVLLCLAAALFSVPTVQAESTTQAENTPKQPLTFNSTKTTDTQIFETQVSIERREEGDVDDTTSFGLLASYGQLFSGSDAGYQGFGYFTGKVNTDNRYRLNASLGYFLPGIGGELLTTYRFLSAEVRDNLAVAGAFEEQADEHSFAASYTRYINTFPKEIALTYSYSLLGGEEGDRITRDLDSATTW